MAELPFDPPLQWSRGRSATLRTCPRKLYFQVFLAWQGWNHAYAKGGHEAHKFLAYRLGKITSLPALRGTIIHDLIDAHLETIAKSGLNAEVFINQAVTRFSKSLDDSIEGLWKKNVKAYTNLHEVYYGKHFDRESEIARTREAAERACETLIESYCLEERLNEQWTHHWTGPKLFPGDSFPRFITPEWEMNAIPDLVGFNADDGTCDVIDWKTGKPSQNDVEQLVHYAIAMEAWQKAGRLPKPLQGGMTEPNMVLVYLSTGEEHEVQVNDEAKEEILGRYREDHQRMLQLVDIQVDDVTGGKVMVERDRDSWKQFEPCLKAGECRRCPFLQMCAGELGLNGPEAAKAFVNAGASESLESESGSEE